MMRSKKPLVSIRRHKRRIPVFPDWLIPELAHQAGDFLPETSVGKLPHRRRCHFYTPGNNE
jgi:hypothetical protein